MFLSEAAFYSCKSEFNKINSVLKIYNQIKRVIIKKDKIVYVKNDILIIVVNNSYISMR